VHDLDAAPSAAQRPQLSLDGVLVADQEDLGMVLASRPVRTSNDRSRCVISTHGIDRDVHRARRPGRLP
jgi:hypothetical protein